MGPDAVALPQELRGAGDKENAGFVLLFPELLGQRHAAFASHEDVQAEQRVGFSRRQSGLQLLGGSVGSDGVLHLHLPQHGLTLPAQLPPQDLLVFTNRDSIHVFSFPLFTVSAPS